MLFGSFNNSFICDSLAVIESQIKELLKDPNNISLSLKDDQQDNFSSENEVDGSVTATKKFLSFP